jgi:hypothetical protein
VQEWLAQFRLSWLAQADCAHRREKAAYRPPGFLRHLVKVRHRTCAAPGCRRPAGQCDDDHTVPYARGGRTCECNLSPLCRRHHRCKQAPGWRLEQPEPGILNWQTPAGRIYVTRPAAYPV